MTYVLVILRGSANAGDEGFHAPEHERFIDSLIARNLVLLGGGFSEPVGDAYAAYVLRCNAVDDARAIAGQDPFVVHDVLRPEFAEWQLVGINTDAIDAAAVVRPQDVHE